jgi:NAD+ synthase
MSLEIQAEKVAEKIEGFIREKVNEFQRDGVILGMSGGIDSALTGTLAVRALGAENVLALLLPERDSSKESKTDALITIEELGIPYREISIKSTLDTLGVYKILPLQFLVSKRVKETVVREQHQRQVDAIGEMPFRAGLLGTRDAGAQQDLLDAGNAYTRAKHRIRLVTLYFNAEQENRLVLGTTNKSEAMTGFVVKWGDNVADIEPILPLYKTQVWALAKHLGVDSKIIEKAPTPDLLPGIVDEFALGVEYLTLDQILYRLEHAKEKEAIASELGLEVELVEHVAEMVHRSQHLRELPPAPVLD